MMRFALCVHASARCSTRRTAAPLRAYAWRSDGLHYIRVLGAPGGDVRWIWLTRARAAQFKLSTRERTL
jgi:hypothetical protein